jgi:hypothetical protein
MKEDVFGSGPQKHEHGCQYMALSHGVIGLGFPCDKESRQWGPAKANCNVDLHRLQQV